MRQRKFSNIKKLLDTISENPGLSEEELRIDTQLPEELFSRTIHGMEKRGLIENIDGEYFVTERAKNFSEESMRHHKRGFRPPHGNRHHDRKFDGRTKRPFDK